MDEKIKWSGQRDLNPRPSAWEANALPTELCPLKKLRFGKAVILSSIQPAVLFPFNSRWWF